MHCYCCQHHLCYNCLRSVQLPKFKSKIHIPFFFSVISHKRTVGRAPQLSFMESVYYVGQHRGKLVPIELLFPMPCSQACTRRLYSEEWRVVRHYWLYRFLPCKCGVNQTTQSDVLRNRLICNAVSSPGFGRKLCAGSISHCSVLSENWWSKTSISKLNIFIFFSTRLSHFSVLVKFFLHLFCSPEVVQ